MFYQDRLGLVFIFCPKIAYNFILFLTFERRWKHLRPSYVMNIALLRHKESGIFIYHPKLYFAGKCHFQNHHQSS